MGKKGIIRQAPNHFRKSTFLKQSLPALFPEAQLLLLDVGNDRLVTAFTEFFRGEKNFKENTGVEKAKSQDDPFPCSLRSQASAPEAGLA